MAWIGRRSDKVRLAAGIAVLATALGACISSGPGAGLSDGTITISGSSTVEPISALVAEKYQQAKASYPIRVDGPGTPIGFDALCKKEAGLVGAARAIENDERGRCRAEGVDWVELEIARDGLTLITSADSDGVTCLGSKDLYALAGPESNGYDRWSDADEFARDLRATHEPYPDEKLIVSGPDELSGTYESLVEMTIAKIADERFQDAGIRSDYTGLDNDSLIAQDVGAVPYVLGWVGFPTYKANDDTLKAIAYEGTDGKCVAPSEETISDGRYGLTRSLYLYVNIDRAAVDTMLRDFVDFYVSDAGLQAVTEAGFIALDENGLAETRTRWKVARGD